MATTARNNAADRARKAAENARKNAEKVRKSADEAMHRASKEGKERAARLAKSLVDFQKTTFDSTAKIAGNLQEHSEKRLLEVIDHAEWLPREMKKAVHEWVKTVRRSRSDFKKTMDKSFDLMGQYIGRIEKAEKVAKKPAGKTKAKPRSKAKAKTSSDGKKRAVAKRKTTAKRKPAAAS